MNQNRLRKKLRLLRHSLSSVDQCKAQQKLAAIISVLPEFLDSSHIAVYCANDGEINPVDIVKKAWESGKNCYLPVVDQNKKGGMCFMPYVFDTEMEQNQYGILEPLFSESSVRRAEDLELVLVPLTGFDLEGNRVGMGGGYYDRTFAFKKDAMKQASPMLIGLAHDCQKLKLLQANPWDIPLAGVATDKKFYRFYPLNEN